jgi:hypothetical protein
MPGNEVDTPAGNKTPGGNIEHMFYYEIQAAPRKNRAEQGINCQSRQFTWRKAPAAWLRGPRGGPRNNCEEKLTRPVRQFGLHLHPTSFTVVLAWQYLMWMICKV